MHAGLADTSLALAVDPRLVRTDRLQRPRRSARPRACSGDPRRATRRTGAARRRSHRRATTVDGHPENDVAQPEARTLGTQTPRQSIFAKQHLTQRGCACRSFASSHGAGVARAVLGVARYRRRRRHSPARRAAVATVPGMPPVIDPTNLYSETAAGKFGPAVAGDLPRVYVPQRAVERRLRDRSGHAQGRRQVQGRHQSAACRAVVGHAHAVGRQQRRRTHATAA